MIGGELSIKDSSLLRIDGLQGDNNDLSKRNCSTIAQGMAVGSGLGVSGKGRCDRSDAES